MSSEDRRRLVDGYIEHNTREMVTGPDKVIREVRGADNFWAYLEMDALCRDEPELCLELILQILHAPHKPSVEENLAAGPLEDVLGEWGPRIIERVESLAQTDPEFKQLLGGVWQGGMNSEIWARVQACRGEPW